MGSWKSIKEMEEVLTLDEVYLLVDAMYRKEERHNKFLAAIQGIDLNENEENSDFEDIKTKAAAKLAGISEEQHVFETLGIEMEEDDD